MLEGPIRYVSFLFPLILLIAAISAAIMMGIHRFRSPRLTEEEQAPLSLATIKQTVRDELSEAILKQDSDLVEAALTHALTLACPSSLYFDLACRLVAEDWHISHEWLIGQFQDAEDPRAVPFLRQAIDLKPRLQYLDYDDYGSYYKKCLWALKAIGTPEAISVIRDCANSEIDTLGQEAQYRLSKIGE